MANKFLPFLRIAPFIPVVNVVYLWLIVFIPLCVQRIFRVREVLWAILPLIAYSVLGNLASRFLSPGLSPALLRAILFILTYSLVACIGFHFTRLFLKRQNSPSV